MSKTAICGDFVIGINRPVTKTLLAQISSDRRDQSAGRKKLLLAMKLTAFFLVLSLLKVSAEGLSQSVSFSGRNVTLKEAFKSVEKQTGFVFLYPSSLLKHANPVSVNAVDVPLEDFLSAIFKSQPLEYVIRGKSIFITKAPDQGNISDELQVAFFPIRGRVLDEDGSPLAGASVSVRGRNTTTITDGNGYFSLNVEVGQTLVITYVGHASVAVRVNSANSAVIASVDGAMDAASTNLVGQAVAAGNDGFQIRLPKGSSQLETVEVTVNTGYQTISRDRAAGSFAKPDLNVMLNRTSTTNIITRLEGLVPGLTHRGPGGLLVRGQSSINAETEPLIVVDGIEYEGNIELLNMQDVEDITVLKDATSASIWGAKAANGVIVITTKKGKAGGKLKVDYDGYYAFRGRPDLDYVPRMNSQQFIGLAKELFPQFYEYNQAFTPVSQLFGNLPHLQILYDGKRGLLTQQQVDAKLDSLAALSNTNQINDLFVRDAATLNQTISVSGGGKIHRFYASLNHVGTKDNTPGNKSDQYKVNLNNEFFFGKRLTIGLNADLTNTVTRNGNTYNPSRNIVPYQMFTDANGNPLTINYLGSSPINTTFTDSLRAIYASLSRLDLSYNPILEQDRGYTSSQGLYARLVGSVKLNILDGLDFQGTYGYNISSTDTRNVWHQDNYNMRMLVVRFTQAANPSVTPVYNIPEIGGRMIASTSLTKAWTVRNQFSYNRAWDRHQFTLIGGQQATSSTPLSLSATFYGWDDQLQTSRPVNSKQLASGITGTIMGNSTLGNNNVSGGEGMVARTTSYYSNLSYTFDRKYTLNASWRIDESNVFGRDKSAQNRPVYSVGAMWALGREEFMNNVSWVNRLNVRLTYGITGNAPVVGTGSSYDILQSESNFNYVTGAGYIIVSPGNAKLTWEGTRVYNFGLDFAVLNNRLSGSIETYVRKTTDLIGDLRITPFTGYDRVTGNYGDMENKGIEIGLNSVNVRSGHFSWTSSFTFSHNKNKLIKLEENAPTTGASLVSTTRMVGYPLHTQFAYNYGGLNAVGDPQIILADKSVSAALNIATPDDILYMGTRQPVWSGGFQNTFTYKSLTLSASIVYNGGHKIRSNRNPTFNEQILGNNSLQLGFFDRWKTADDAGKTEIPRYIADPGVAAGRSLSYYLSSNRFILNGAYAKLRDITLGYSLPRNMVSKLNAESVSFRFQLNNLLLWKANDHGMDPEFTGTTRNAQGTFSLGAHISF